MNKRLFQRVLACLLALMILPLPTVFAEEAGTELTVTCRDIFREGEEKTATVLETEDGYYITFDEAIRMIGLIHAGGDYLPPMRMCRSAPIQTDWSISPAMGRSGTPWSRS